MGLILLGFWMLLSLGLLFSAYCLLSLLPLVFVLLLWVWIDCVGGILVVGCDWWDVCGEFIMFKVCLFLFCVTQICLFIAFMDILGLALFSGVGFGWVLVFDQTRFVCCLDLLFCFIIWCFYFLCYFLDYYFGVYWVGDFGFLVVVFGVFGVWAFGGFRFSWQFCSG